MENKDPVMGAKLKSKTHLQNTFCDFLSCFLRKFAKSAKRYRKTQNFTLISNQLKKLKKNAPKKVPGKKNFTNMSKSEKRACFRHIFANNFFWVHFSKLFCSYLHFLYTLIANAQETA